MPENLICDKCKRENLVVKHPNGLCTRCNNEKKFKEVSSNFFSSDESSDIKNSPNNKDLYNEIYIGIGIVLFGIFIGGIGMTSARIGIGIPMIPLGIYLIIRGYNKVQGNTSVLFERTSKGKFLLGILLIFIGIGTGGSALLPILLFGGAGYLIYKSITK